MITENVPKKQKYYNCDKCQYITMRKSQYERHLNSTKHKNDNKNVPKSSSPFMCSCGNIYKFNSGLSRHKKICKLLEQEEKLNNENIIIHQNTIENNTENKNNLENLVVQLITENNEIKNTLLKENQE